MQRQMRARTYLMCSPAHFTISYAINPWMTGDEPVDHARAQRQWQALADTYRSLGHEVRLIDPVPGLPDMVFAANGATVIGRTVLGARFRHAERAGEAPAYLSWLRAEGYAVHEPRQPNEGQGDIVVAGTTILAGHGFRTEPSVRDDLEQIFGMPVVSLRLVDPRYYHLDTALVVLGPGTAAYYPAAFDDAATAALGSVFTELIEAKNENTKILKLNAVNDGHHIMLPAETDNLTRQLATHRFEPVAVEMSEFHKTGDGPKCCTLELR